jgi:prepilin signal peptidase PulO-like enzyme (type II secretory pathway)
MKWVGFLFSGLAFFCGAAFGSWANMLAYRLRRGMSVWHPPRSFCDICGARLGLIELIPVLGWAVSAGRARCCGGKVSPIYPLVELAAGALAAAVAWFCWGGLRSGS